MPCDRPSGDCTSPCGGGCAGPQPVPIVPRCQDIVLTPGTYSRATVVVNEAGCISAVATGEPDPYTPDDCCPGGGTSGGGLPGARGPKGDTGAAATVSVNTSIPVGTTPTWTVENLGTPSAAVFRFTSPAPPVVPPGAAGVTGSVSGLVVDAGRVAGLPPSLVHEVSTEAVGTYASQILFAVSSVSPAAVDSYNIVLNLDAFASKVIADTGVSGIDSRLTAVEEAFGDTSAALFQVAAATGVNVAVSGTSVVPMARVVVIPNTWLVGAAFSGAQVTASDGSFWPVTALGQVTLPALTYPTGLTPATP